ncbi:MAG TPA: hypothetical protein VGA31_12960 [Thermoanaerobaculia bacterium]
MRTDPDDWMRLGRESGRILGELGVDAEDTRWIRKHAESIASLARRARPNLLGYLSRLARKAARRAR